MKSWLRLHGTLATAIAVTLTTVFGSIAAQSWLGVLDPDRIDPAFARGSLFGSGGSVANPSDAAQNASALVAFLFGAVTLVSVIVIIGLIFRQSWAREAGMVIYGFLGLIAIATSLSAITADPPAPSAWLGLLTGLANVAIVIRLLLPATAQDFNPYLRSRARARMKRAGA